MEELQEEKRLSSEETTSLTSRNKKRAKQVTQPSKTKRRRIQSAGVDQDVVQVDQGVDRVDPVGDQGVDQVGGQGEGVDQGVVQVDDQLPHHRGVEGQSVLSPSIERN